MASRHGIQFLFGQHVQHCLHEIDKHFVGYYTLQYMHSGSVDLQISATRQRLAGRWFWSCYDGPRIRFQATAPSQPWDHRYLAFRGPLVESWRRSQLFPIQPLPAPPGENYAVRFDLLLALARRTDALGIHRATLLLESILTELADAQARQPESAWIASSLNQLQDSANGSVDYDRLAANAAMSSRTFRRRFKAAAGVSARTMSIRHRIDRARELLVDSDKPIKKIAAELGYSDVYFFTRQFRQHTGVPPALYRRSREG